MRFSNLALGLAVVAALVVGFVGFSPEKAVPSQNLGGLIHTLQEDFTQGIKVGGVEFVTKDRIMYPALLGTSSAGLNYYANVVTPTADVTLTAAQTGSIVKMAVAGLDVTLPAPTAGLNYRFVVTAAVATTNMTVVAGTADTIEGTLIVAGAVVDCDAADVLNFVIDGENIGDYVDLYSDGTSWLIGSSGVLTAAKLTCTG